MDMKPDEIVVRYRQAKEKGKQLNILAELNACSVDDIVHVLVEHGGYKLERMSRSRCKTRLLKEEEEAPAKELVKTAAEAIKSFGAALTKGQELEKQIPYKKPEIIPEPPKPEPVPEPAKELEKEKIPPVVKRALDSGFHYLADEIDARLNRIEELKAEIAEFEKDIAALRAWEEEHT